jgi:ABC-type transporter Mla subunit MlaD
LRHNTLTLQNRAVGAVVALLAIWGAVTLIGTIREQHAGSGYFTLTTDVMGVQVGSIVTLNGFEIGQVNAVALESAGEQAQNAASLVFRVDFQIVTPVVFPAQTTYLSIEEVNPVAPARLVIKQLPAAQPEDAEGGVELGQSSAKVIYGCPTPRPIVDGVLTPGACIPTLAVEEDMRPGLSGLISAATAALITLDQTIGEFAQLGQEIRGNNAQLAKMLSDDPDNPGNLYQLPAALEDAATRMADVTEGLHRDVVERIDRMVTPETIASLERATAQLEELIATTGHGSQETLENLAAITRSLNRITWELERDPIGFLRGPSGGTR